jgi:hypothetical protein
MKLFSINKRFFVAIIAAGIFALSQIPLSNTALADKNNNNDDQIPSTVTIPLEGLRLKAGQFILLSDTTPVHVDAAHVAINVPCKDGNNNDPKSDIAVVAGVAPNVKPVDLQYVKQLSDPEDNCTYHVDIPEDNDDKVTDIAIINPGHGTVEFKSGNFATISVTEVSD